MLHVMVRRALWFVCGATLCVAAAGAHAQAPAEQTARAERRCADEDGCLLSSELLTLTKPYAELDDLAKLRFPQVEYDEARNQRDFESLRITYRSGGLRIVGFIYKPKHTTGRKLPAIVFNRGGTADFGAIEPEELVTFYFWAKEGFVVLASNYRGGGGSEGVDEWGGRDVDDVMNLIPLAARPRVHRHDEPLHGWPVARWADDIHGHPAEDSGQRRGCDCRTDRSPLGEAARGVCRGRRPGVPPYGLARLAQGVARFRATGGRALREPLRGRLARRDRRTAPAAPQPQRLRGCRSSTP